MYFMVCFNNCLFICLEPTIQIFFVFRGDFLVVFLYILNCQNQFFLIYKQS